MLDRFMRVAHPLPRRRGNVAARQPHVRQRPAVDVPHGSPWRDLPECCGKWVTVCQLFNRWSRNGATGRLFAALQEKRINGAESQPHQTFCFLLPPAFRALSHAARFHGSTGFFGGSPYSGRMNV